MQEHDVNIPVAPPVRQRKAKKAKKVVKKAAAQSSLQTQEPSFTPPVAAQRQQQGTHVKLDIEDGTIPGIDGPIPINQDGFFSVPCGKVTYSRCRLNARGEVVLHNPDFPTKDMRLLIGEINADRSAGNDPSASGVRPQTLHSVGGDVEVVHQVKQPLWVPRDKTVIVPEELVQILRESKEEDHFLVDVPDPTSPLGRRPEIHKVIRKRFGFGFAPILGEAVTLN